jgi:hypothetical protein
VEALIKEAKKAKSCKKDKEFLPVAPQLTVVCDIGDKGNYETNEKA